MNEIESSKGISKDGSGEGLSSAGIESSWSLRDEVFAEMSKGNSDSAAATKENHDIIIDFGDQKLADPFQELRRQMQEAREKQREKDINSIVESITKSGQLPDNVRDMLRDFEPMLYAGFHGDAAGLADLLASVNKGLEKNGSPYRLDMESFERQSGGKDMRDRIYDSWTEHVISVKNGKGYVTDRTSVVTDPIPNPDIRF